MAELTQARGFLTARVNWTLFSGLILLAFVTAHLAGHAVLLDWAVSGPRGNAPFHALDAVPSFLS